MKLRFDVNTGGFVGYVAPLSTLKTGESGEIVDVFGCESTVTRLAESGLRLGSTLEVLATGNPLVLRVNETRLSYRHDGRVEVMVDLQ